MPIAGPVQCDVLRNPNNGKVTFIARTVGSFAKYVCNNGYILSGNRFRKCETTGWTGEAPTCKPEGENFVKFITFNVYIICKHFELHVSYNYPLVRTCDNLRDPANGDVDQSGNRPGSTATYTCDRGYVLVGQARRSCKNNGEWSGKAPTCRRIITCSDLADPAGGNVELSGNRPGDTASYTCNRGYDLVGKNTRTCQDNGKWSGEAPRCRLVVCETLRDPANGDVDQNGNRPGSTATYTCDRGYVLVGQVRRTCQNNGEWSGEAPTCKRIIKCPDLADPAGGNVELSGNRPGDTASYTCNRGYDLVGKNTRTCQDNGKWSGEAPRCRLVICETLRDPANGDVDQSGNRPGSTATYTCNRGYVLVGQARRTCQDNGKWSGKAPTCRLVTCEKLRDPANGDVDQSGNRPGSTATYTCDRGYVLVGQARRSCQNNGEWSGKAPTCKRIITCSDLADPAGGNVELSGNKPGDTASYTCNRGYDLVGKNTRTCQVNGKWSGEAPRCRLVVCETLRDPANGDVDQSGNRPGSTATYTCVRGYELVGEDTRICQDNGEWSGEAPRCRLITCETLADPANGDVDQSGNRPGSTATYTCVRGYELVGEDTRICQDNGEWSGEVPRCRLITCETLSDPANGDVDQSGNRPGSTATYTCVRGYELVGEDTRICQDNGEWSGEAPRCRLITCETLADPANGDVDQSGNRPGSTATYTCVRGYELVGEDTRICQDNGEWSGEAPRCRLITCETLADPANGDVDQSGNRPGSTATYTCVRGYELVGEDTRICQDNGEWSGEAPRCRLITCETLADPANGDVDQSGNRPGSTATYTCVRGYELVGEDTRICQDNGEWSGEVPHCRLITCETLADPANGDVDQSDNRPGSTATYTCVRGYELVGEDTRTCQDNGEWSGEAPRCRLITCETLADPANGDVDQSDNRPGSTATYTCVRGYELVGEDTRTCQDNGEWSGEAPRCRLINCETLADPANGDVDQSGNRPGSTATYTCVRGYDLVGEDTRICQDNGEWSGEVPHCRLITCETLADPANGDVDQSDNRPGSTATYTCVRGYELVGEDTRTCQDNGEWSGEAPRCRLITCETLADPANGDVDQSDNRPGSTATYTCVRGYELVGEDTRTCQDNGEWSGEAPRCRLITCETLADPANGDVDQSGNRPGSTATYTCVRGYELVGEDTRICQDNGEWSGEAPRCRRKNIKKNNQLYI